MRGSAAMLHVGTSGWSYQHWSGGVFYPEKMKQGDWLAYYATRFDTVEINMSFYRLPGEAMIRRWEAMAPAGFHYAVKMWRMITHRKLLRDSGDLIERFMGVVGGLGARRGPLLVQLPPRLDLDPGRLDGFLKELKAVIGRAPWRIAVEFRNPAWLVPEVTDLLTRHNAALVLHDMAGSDATEPNAADFVYIRRHGAAGRYAGEYTEAQLETEARVIRSYLAQGRDVWIYYNNDAAGAAVRNALQLKELLGK